MDLLKKILYFIFLLFLTTSYSVAEKIPRLSWDDLMPTDIIDPVSKYKDEERDLINWTIYLNENLNKEETEINKRFHLELKKNLPIIKKMGVNIKEVLAIRKRMDTEVVKKWHNKKISIPGFLLPLELSGKRVKEFLLVPYVGACIHVPPPPPNQIINVTMANKKGYKHKKIYEPVLITGVLKINSVTKNLFLSDGSADIDIGYQMKAFKISKYDKEIK
jgi:uncharacterized protein